MVNDVASPGHVDALVEQARALDDEGRRALADALRGANEVVRAGAWRAAYEMLAPRAGAYVDAWARMGPAYVPERLEELLQRGSGVDTAEVARWQEVARLARVAIDDALLALLVADTIPPPATRELYEPWRRMLTGAAGSGSPP